MADLSISGRIHSVETFGAVDGPGIRYVVFLQGCALRCIYCHNPDTWEINAGKSITVGELISDIMSYKNFLSGGVTVSGGEPLLQPQFTAALLDVCRENGLHTALDTAGSVGLCAAAPVIDKASMLLLDIKGSNTKTSADITGRQNILAQELDILNYCEKTGKDVWIRHVLLPGYTLKTDMLSALAMRLKGYTCIKKIELLPFHKMGEYKWQHCGRTYTLNDTMPPDPKEIEAARKIFSEFENVSV